MHVIASDRAWRRGGFKPTRPSVIPRLLKVGYSVWIKVFVFKYSECLMLRKSKYFSNGLSADWLYVRHVINQRPVPSRVPPPPHISCSGALSSWLQFFMIALLWSPVCVITLPSSVQLLGWVPALQLFLIGTRIHLLFYAVMQTASHVHTVMQKQVKCLRLCSY